MRAGRHAKGPVVLRSTLALIISNGPIIPLTFAVLLKPVSDELHWPHGSTSLGLTFALMLAGLATLVAGRLVDRSGIRRVTLVVITLFAASFAATSLVPNSAAAFILAYSLAGLFASGHSPLPYARAISGWFQAGRGLALGIAMAGVGIAVMPVIANLLQRFGWRGAYAATGLLVWLVAFPSVLLLVRDPPLGAGTATVDLQGEDVATVLPLRPFWLMTASLLVVLALSAILAHPAALLADADAAREVALSALVTFGVSAILGRLVSGFLLDRLFAPHLSAALFLMPLMMILGGAMTPSFVLFAAVCLGFSLGAEFDMIGVGSCFRLRRHTEIYGDIFAVFTIGSGIGPYLLGLSFDHTGNDRLGVATDALVLVAASGLMLLEPYRDTVDAGRGNAASGGGPVPEAG